MAQPRRSAGFQFSFDAARELRAVLASLGERAYPVVERLQFVVAEHRTPVQRARREEAVRPYEGQSGPLSGEGRKELRRLANGLRKLLELADAIRIGEPRRSSPLAPAGPELSWILEDNAGMRSIIESIGGNAYKRYRVYERELDAA